jgi:hypothetical protein
MCYVIYYPDGSVLMTSDPEAITGSESGVLQTTI